MTTNAPLRLTLLAISCLLLAACGGDDADSSTATGAGDGDTPSETVVETTAPDTGDAPATPDDTGAVDALDVCAMVTQEDVETVIGMPAGAAQPESEAGFYFGCRYEEEGLSQIVTIGVFAYGDPQEATTAFEFGADQYPAVEGVGDRAYNAQPINDISVLSGRYEVSVGLYFVDDSDEAELAMARQLAEAVIGQLP